MVAKNNFVGIAQAKMQFFDRQIFSAAERAEKRVLSRFGAYVRNDAKKSMRSSRGRIVTTRTGRQRRVFKPSKPGKPPKSIEGLLRRFVYYAYDKYKGTVVAGPTILPNKSRHGVPIPGLHEHGGTQVVRFGKKQVVAKYPARPYMRPAGEKNTKKLGQLWKDAIK